MAGNLQLNLNIKVDAGNAPQQISTITNETQNLGRIAQTSSVNLDKTAASLGQVGINSQAAASYQASASTQIAALSTETGNLVKS